MSRAQRVSVLHRATYGALALCALACGGPSVSVTKQEGKSEDAPKKPLPDPVVEGSVRLVDGAEPPTFLLDEMERKVLTQAQRGAWPEVCTPPKILDRSPLRVSEQGGLSNVVVAASGFSRNRSRAPKTHEVVIRDCRLTPSVIVAMKGDTLRVKNEVDYPFMPAYGKIDALRTLSPGQNYDVTLEPGVGQVTCGFVAPCGRTDVVVLQHPLATVTDDKGNFRLEGFAAEDHVTISAWHPLLQESTAPVDLVRGQTPRVDLSVKPIERAPQAVPAEAAPTELAPGAKDAPKSTKPGPAAAQPEKH